MSDETNDDQGSVWLTGRTFEGNRKQWEVLGIYSSEKRAHARCTRSRDFVAPITVDEDHPEETVEMPGAVYPLWQESR